MINISTRYINGVKDLFRKNYMKAKEKNARQFKSSWITYIYVGFLSVNVSHDTDAASVTGLIARNQRQPSRFLYK